MRRKIEHTDAFKALFEELGAAVRDNTQEELISKGLETCLDFETGGES